MRVRVPASDEPCCGGTSSILTAWAMITILSGGAMARTLFLRALAMRLISAFGLVGMPGCWG